MSRRLIVCVAVLISAFAQMASAQFTNLASVPFTNSYEFPLLVGDSILTNADAGAWYGSEGSEAYVTNLPYTPPGSYPLPDAAHSNILVFSSLEGEIISAFDPVETVSYQQIWVETMMQPVFSEELPISASITNSLMSICFLATNGVGWISIYHGAFNEPGNFWSVQSETNLWSTFPTQVHTGDWVRLSVAVSYNDLDQAKPAFSVKLNGTPLSNEFSFAIGEGSGFTPGSWFRCTTDTKLSLNEIALAGSGALDDLLVTDSEPAFTLFPVIYVQSFGIGSVTPSGTVVLPAEGSSTNFIINSLSVYRYIKSLKTNNIYVGAAWDQQVYTQSWSNVIGTTNTLDVDFAERVASNGIPYEWLDANGLGTNDVSAAASNQWNDLAAGDWDKDGMDTFEEWIAGTKPKDSNSLLRIISETMSNGFPVIKWLSSTGTLNNVPYTFEVSSNLVKQAAWTLLPTNIPASGTGTNTLLAPVSTTMSPAFFRVTVSNTYTPAP
jgi:hypothetical protein